MCGIVGIVTTKIEGLSLITAAMTDSLTHRGPDDSGTAVLPADGVALGVRRLSILDIAGGHQPMWDENREHCVVFNGEIYNYRALRDSLVALGHTFSSHHSDTEVLAHGYEQWGVGLFPKLLGMFAIAIWDRRNRELVVARDRAGEKPLYIARLPSGFAVASELKALMVHPEVRPELDVDALEEYLSFDFIVGPRTILRNVEKLPGGHYAAISDHRLRVCRYWTLTFDQQPWREDDAAKRLDRLLDQSVASMLVADVPVGLFLSGGLDSTTIGYYMTRNGADVQSFSIGFTDASYDESTYAALAASHLGTKHHTEVFGEHHIRELVPRIASILDEPMADQSIFPTYLLSQFTRGHVKVALGGDGGDELLMGYRTYLALKVAWQMDVVPMQIRRTLARGARHIPAHFGPLKMRGRRFAERLGATPVERLLSALGSFNGNARWLLSPDVKRALSKSVFRDAVAALTDYKGPTDPATATIAGYLRGYLQEDILVKVDRASMAASLEVRSPFLDPRVVAFLCGVPSDLKLKGVTGKHLLRKVMRGRIPDAIIDRRKHGFGVPLNGWLRTSLGPMMRDYLNPTRIADAGLLDASVVERIVEEHVSGRGDHGQVLWSLLLLELWRDNWLLKTPRQMTRQA